jgi:hypothetical protein
MIGGRRGSWLDFPTGKEFWRSSGNGESTKSLIDGSENSLRVPSKVSHLDSSGSAASSKLPAVIELDLGVILTKRSVTALAVRREVESV